MASVIKYNPDSVVPNQVMEFYQSVNTPDYEGLGNYIINPDLSQIQNIPMYYWIVESGLVVEMNQDQKDVINNILLTSAKAARKDNLRLQANMFLESKGYTSDVIQHMVAMYAKGTKNKPKKGDYLEPVINWFEDIQKEVAIKQNLVDSATLIETVNSINIDTSNLTISNPNKNLKDAVETVDSNDLDHFLNSQVEVTDPATGIKGPFYLIQLLLTRKDLYNDNENPLYESGYTSILGSGGYLVDHANRILNVENLHSKESWHSQQIYQALNDKPKNLLIYYGYLNSFNYDVNGWSNEKVAQDMSKYDIIVMGNGVQESSHPDYANSQIIIPRIKQLNPSTLLFGYVAAAQTYSAFQTKVDEWNTLQVHGIFIDEAGYDYGKNRSEFNTMVSYIHSKTYSNLCFANAWNLDNILGIANDETYPNTTYNPSLEQSNLSSSDWVLLESFPINTDTSGVFISSELWSNRGQKSANLKSVYGVNVAGISIINNDNISGQALFNFGYTSALMYSLESYGSSDVLYSSSSAKSTFWNRPTNYGTYYAKYPGVNSSTLDSGIYLRYTDSSELKVNFTNQTSNITSYSTVETGGTSGYSGYSGSAGASGISGYSGSSNGITTLRKTSDQIVNGTSFRDIDGLTFPVTSGTDYAYDFYITFRTANTGTGFKFGVNGPSGVVDYFHTYQTINNSSTAGVATWLQRHDVTFDSMTATTSTISGNVDLHSRITGRYKCEAAGTFAARVGSESANNDITVQKGSWGIYF